MERSSVIPTGTCFTYLAPKSVLDFQNDVGDEWPKLNYDNMAKVDRMVALGLLMLADSNIPPKWTDTEAKTKRYVEAWNTLHADGTK